MDRCHVPHVKPGKAVPSCAPSSRTSPRATPPRRPSARVRRWSACKTLSKDMQYLYMDGPQVVLMDNETYEQITVNGEDIENLDLLAPNSEVGVLFVREAPFRVEVPTFVELTVTQTDPGMKGDTVSNVFKPAQVETGATVSVPLSSTRGTASASTRAPASTRHARERRLLHRHDPPGPLDVPVGIEHRRRRPGGRRVGAGGRGRRGHRGRRPALRPGGPGAAHREPVGPPAGDRAARRATRWASWCTAGCCGTTAGRSGRDPAVRAVRRRERRPPPARPGPAEPRAQPARRR